jgi:hypothetical protein
MSKKSHSKRITALNNGLKNALLHRVQGVIDGKPFKDDELLSAPPSKSPAQTGNDPIIAKYIAWRKVHPQGPLPKSLTDRVTASIPGVDLERIGKSFVSDIMEGQSK